VASLGARTGRWSFLSNIDPRNNHIRDTVVLGLQTDSEQGVQETLQAESQVLGVQAQKKAALNGINYDFELTGQERAPSGSTYLLRVSPKRKGKFLYRGRIWVDAKDFAVTRLEGEPTKNFHSGPKAAKSNAYTKRWAFSGCLQAISLPRKSGLAAAPKG
jgi:hypothetical protein